MKPTAKAETKTYSTFLDGKVVIRYARTEKYPYGSLGSPRIVRWLPDFHDKCVVPFVKELVHYIPTLSSIILSGAWHDTIEMNKKDTKHGVCRHCQGRAIDIDSIWWDRDENGLVTKSGYTDYRRNYLGIEAVLRRHFGTVLSWTYNIKHQDHFHCDNGTAPGLRLSDLSGKSRNSRVSFIQDALTTVFGKQLAFDGRYGAATEKALQSVLPLDWEGDEYNIFCKLVADYTVLGNHND